MLLSGTIGDFDVFGYILVYLIRQGKDAIFLLSVDLFLLVVGSWLIFYISDMIF